MPTKLSNPVTSFVLAGLVALTPCCGEDTPQGPDTNNGTNGNPPDTIPPAAVTGLMVKTPTASSLVLQWVAPGDDGNSGQARRYDIRHSDSPITEQNWDSAIPVGDPPAPKPAGELEQFVVKGLLSVRDYHFALKSYDEVPNESDLSNCEMGTTEIEQSQPSAITDLAARATSDTTFVLTWTATGDDGTWGRAHEYDIRYAATAITEQNFDAAEQVDGEPPPVASGEADSMTVTGLSPGINYYFAMKVGDEVPNWSGLSNSYFAIAMATRVFVHPKAVEANQGNHVDVWYRTPADGNAAVTVSAIDWKYPFPVFIARHLVSGFHTAGVHRTVWDLMDDDGVPVSTMYQGIQVRLHIGPAPVDSVFVRLTG